MNKKQIVALWIGVALSAWIAYHPPYRYITKTIPNPGYSELLKDIEPKMTTTDDASTDVSLLLVREGVVVFVTIAAIVTLADRKRLSL